MLSHIYLAEPPMKLPEHIVAKGRHRDGQWRMLYPVTLTTHRSESRNQMPVAMINQKVVMPEDAPNGELIAFDKETFDRATLAGYKIILVQPRLWRKAYRKGIPMNEFHWHPNARLVQQPEDAIIEKAA